MIALIPARAGSERVPKKNTRLLHGHPLIAYSIALAQQIPEVSLTVVSTECDEIREIAESYGADVFKRTPKYAANDSPDIDWVREVVAAYPTEFYVLLRPTSPFRTVDMVRRAFQRFVASEADSLRAVELVEQHPGKMWHLLSPTRMVPLHPTFEGWSSPTQTLPPVYVQNASLEIFRRTAIFKQGSLSGHTVCPFVCPPPEGYDINTEKDWAYAEAMAGNAGWTLPAFDDN